MCPVEWCILAHVPLTDFSNRWLSALPLFQAVNVAVGEEMVNQGGAGIQGDVADRASMVNRRNCDATGCNDGFGGEFTLPFGPLPGIAEPLLHHTSRQTQLAGQQFAVRHFGQWTVGKEPFQHVALDGAQATVWSLRIG